MRDWHIVALLLLFFCLFRLMKEALRRFRRHSAGKSPVPERFVLPGRFTGPAGAATMHVMKWMALVRQFRCPSACLVGLLALALCVAPAVCAARTPGKAGLRRPSPPPAGASASGWTFGADEAQTARWRQGISGAELQHQAVSGAGRRSGVSGATARAGKRADDGKKSAMAAAAPSGGDRSGVYLSWERDITTWQPETPTRIRQAGEVFSLHQRHIVRAQARAGDKNASVSVGPEVILKDDNDKAVAKDPHSPDSAVGFGMHFMLGF